MKNLNKKYLLLSSTIIIATVFIGGCTLNNKTQENAPISQIKQIDKTPNSSKDKNDELVINDPESNDKPILPPKEEDLPQLSIKFNSSSCEQNNSYAKFDIIKNETSVASVSVPNCESTKGGFITADNNYGYFSILPSGLGGYILYGKYANLYQLNLNDDSVKKIFDKTLTDVDFSYNMNRVVYLKDNNIIIKNIDDFSEKKYALPTQDDNAQFGSFKFSPDVKKVAIAAGYGPDNERGEIYILDLENNGSYSMQEKTDSPSIQIDGWGTDGNIVWRKK